MFAREFKTGVLNCSFELNLKLFFVVCDEFKLVFEDTEDTMASDSDSENSVVELASEKKLSIPWNDTNVKNKILSQVFLSKVHIAEHGSTEKKWQEVTNLVLGDKMFSKYKKVSSSMFKKKYNEYIDDVTKRSGINSPTNTSGLEEPTAWEMVALDIIRDKMTKESEAQSKRESETKRSETLVAREGEVLPRTRTLPNSSSSSNQATPDLVQKRQKLDSGDPFMRCLETLMDLEKRKLELQEAKFKFKRDTQRANSKTGHDYYPSSQSTNDSTY